MPTDPTELAAVPLFAGLDADRLRRLAACAPPRSVDAGTVIALRGEPADRLIIVESGVLTATCHTSGGRRLRLGEFAAPCVVDKPAVLDGAGYTATWVATTGAKLRLMPSEAFIALLDDLPAVRRHAMRTLAAQVRGGLEATVEAYVTDAATRIARWLLQAMGRTGRTRVALPGAQEGLAETIGVTRVSVNRALRILTDERLIRVEPGAVTIRDPESLRRRAAPCP